MKTKTTNWWRSLSLFSALCCASVVGQTHAADKTEQWGVYELSLQGPAAGNPYLDVTVGAEFKNGSHTVTVPGFYDGDGVYRIRFSPDRVGQWTYVTKSDRAELGNRSGSFECTAPTGNNHGPVRVVNTHHFQYADGSPIYVVGTTSYQWTSVKQSIQEQTVKTLATSPFNKMRMCVFPKSYSYGNTTEPWMLPFQKQDGKNDFAQPTFEFFQNFDRRVRQLMELGIQADVILFHPYDRWGYSQMGKNMNERYVRYLIARLSAYRNVWWSLANEWDIKSIKDTIDWEGIGNLLLKEDPHQRLRGIHNWYHDESHFYDHSRPWVTHVSAQTYYFFNAIKWRNKYQKPLLYDEMRYEGDVSSGWGNMSAKEMTSYFWKAGLSGGYGTHGDTFKNDSDTETEVRWWAKGGTLMGQSPTRIAFFKKIMEEAPVIAMTPQMVKLTDEAIPATIPDKNDGKLVTALNNCIYILSKEGEQYLAYTADTGRTIKLNLSGARDYTLQARQGGVVPRRGEDDDEVEVVRREEVTGVLREAREAQLVEHPRTLARAAACGAHFHEPAALEVTRKCEVGSEDAPAADEADADGTSRGKEGRSTLHGRRYSMKRAPAPQAAHTRCRGDMARCWRLTCAAPQPTLRPRGDAFAASDLKRTKYDRDRE